MSSAVLYSSFTCWKELGSDTWNLSCAAPIPLPFKPYGSATHFLNFILCMLATLYGHLCTSRGNQHTCGSLSTQTMTNHVREEAVWHGSVVDLCRFSATASTLPIPKPACYRPKQSLVGMSSSEPHLPLKSALFFSSHICPHTWHLSLHTLPLGVMDGQGTWQNSVLLEGSMTLCWK